MSRVLKRFWLTSVLICALGAGAVLLPAASQAQTGATITGTITDSVSHAGISGATVEAVDGSSVLATTTTASNGTYTLSGLQPNENYYVTASESSYVSNGQDANVTATTGTSSFTLSPAGFSGTITDNATGYPLYNAEIELFDGSGGGTLVTSVYTDANGYYAFPETYYSAGQTYYVEVQGQVDSDSADYTTPYYRSGSIGGSATVAGATGLAPATSTSQFSGINIAPAATEGSIAGRITDAAGEVNGAKAVAVLQNTDDNYTSYSSSTGTYVIPGLPAGTYTMDASPSSQSPDVTTYYGGVGDANASTPVSVASAGVTPAINVKMQAGATISGTITNSSGTGLPDVEVLVETAGGSIVADAYTNSGSGAGAYFINGVPAGTYYVYVNASKGDTVNEVNYLSQWYGATSGAANATNESQASQVSVAAGGGATVSQALATGGELTGTISDATSGDGLAAGVDVYSVSSNTEDGLNEYAYAPADSSTGKYTLYGVQPGNYHAYVSASGDGGYAHYTGSGYQYFNDAYAWFNGSALADSEAASTPFTVTANATTTVSAALPAAADIQGTVTSNGQPLQNVEVTLYDGQTGSVGNDLNGTETAADGTYSLTNLLPGTYKVGFFTLQPEPGGGVSIALREHAHIVSTGAEGQASLAFQFYNNVTTLSAASNVALTAGQNQTGVNATLVPGGAISGTVTDAASGKPLSGQSVDLLDASGNLLEQTTTGDDGTYTLSSVPAGTWYVEFDATGTSDQTQFYKGSQVLAGATPVSVTAGQMTAGINGALSAATTPGTTTTVTVSTTPPKPTIGKPSATALKLGGIAGRKVTLSFKLTEGKNAAKLKSVRVTLPKGFSFVSAKLKKDLKVSAKDTYKLSKGVLTITLKTAAASFTVSFKAGSISVTKAIALEDKKHKLASAKVSLLIASSSGVKTTLTETVKKPG